MNGRTCVVTGANSGIGKVTSTGLAALGARVMMVVRDRGRGEAARDDVFERSGNENIDLLVCDLSSQRQIRELAVSILEACRELHVVVNNAGLTLGRRQLTEDGLETTFAVNHMAPFLLTNLLLDRLAESAPARVVTVASDAHRGVEIDLDHVATAESYSSWRAYQRSKLANILFTRELARRIEGSGVTATCMHPGVVRTGFGRQGPAIIRIWFKLVGAFLLKPEQGAETVLWLATAPEVAGESGGYYEKRRRVRPAAPARDDETAAALWNLSSRLANLEAG